MGSFFCFIINVAHTRGEERYEQILRQRKESLLEIKELISNTQLLIQERCSQRREEEEKNDRMDGYQWTVVSMIGIHSNLGSLRI